MQRSTGAEVLNIWMDTPKLPSMSSQDADGNPIAEQQDDQDSDTESLHETTPASSATNPIYEELHPVNVIRPFLEWLVLDDFGNHDESAPEVKVERFLSAIYHSLSASCVSQSTVSGPSAAQTLHTGETSNHGQAAQIGQANGGSQNPQVELRRLIGQSGQTVAPGHASLLGQSPLTGRTSQASQFCQGVQLLPTQASCSGRHKFPVVGRTSKDVDDLTYQLQQQTVGNATIVEQQLRKETANLFECYVPATHNESLVPVRLFWGLLYELIVRSLLVPIKCLNTKAINRSIVSTCRLSSRRFERSTNGPSDCISESIFSIVLLMNLEQNNLKALSPTVLSFKQR